jgi:hypothetical protein
MSVQANNGGKSKLAARLLAAASGAWLLAWVAGPASGASYNFVPVSSTAADVPKATCGSGDSPESLLQGQVPLSARVSGFKGYSCNLKLLSAAHSRRGDGHWQQFVLAQDRKGHTCGYGGPAYWTGAPGTTVVDLTDPYRLHETALITTPGLTMPAEGIRASTTRGLLVGAYYNNEPSTNDVTHGFDIYDIGTDCRHPQALVSTTSITFPTAGLTVTGPRFDRIYGHEGALSPDDKTYWVADAPHGVYHAIDISDPSHPKWLAGFATSAFLKQQATTHGISISDDGNRAYAATDALPGPSGAMIAPATGEFRDGFVIMDTSEVQARKPHPRIHLISENDWHDGSVEQMTIPIKIHGKPYLVTTSEGGVGLATKNGIEAACQVGRIPFGMARIFDINDEAKPRLVKNLVLEVNDPKNCSLIMPEITAMESGDPLAGSFLYDIHMCSVDNRDDATTLACGYFNSGIRVYDIRDPANPKEIAYWVPPARAPGAIEWCAAIPILDASKGMLYSSCADSGVVAHKFEHGVWPFPNSTTPPEKQL